MNEAPRNPATNPPCVILAGGRGTRMGGADKALLRLRGMTLLGCVQARLAGQSGLVALNANGDASRFAGCDLPVLADSLPDYPGPLAGILAAMDWAAGLGVRAVVTVAADTPFFPTDLIARLAQAGQGGLTLAASPDETGRVRLHPTFGLWPVDLRDALRRDLAAGQRKIMLWAQNHGARQALWPATPFDPFLNINTPEDLARAEALAPADQS